MNKATTIKGISLLFLGIIIGAFLAHTLRKVLTPEQMISFETGVKYQFYAGFTLVIIGLNESKFSFPLKLVTNLFFVGSCLFSVSIYLLNLFSTSSVVKFLGPITPIGGSLMIVSLGILLFKLIISQNKAS